MKHLEVMNGGKKADILAALQSDILKLQGFKQKLRSGVDPVLGPINVAFPNQTFPVGAVHEFIASSSEDAAASCGFISGILATLAGDSGPMLWIGSCRKVFPPALKTFGVKPEHIFFIDLPTQQHILWVMEEALKCKAISAVIGEIPELSFTASRRLQLAVEESQVTGFILRQNPRNINTTVCISRWRITSLASEPIDDLPGLGYPAWRVELLRIRNGKPGIWELKWTPSGFKPISRIYSQETSDFLIHANPQNRKTG